MSTCKTQASQWVLLSLCMQLMAACEEQPVQMSRGMAGPTSATAAKPAVGPKGPEVLVLKDDDFAESERHRDPFRAYTNSFKAGGVGHQVALQRNVIMPDTPVEEMKLIAIISGLARAKAMLTDTKSVGYVVQRGDYIGRPKVFQTTGSVSVTLNWRVDRIRDNEVVLIRQDPSDPGRPPLSRIITLRDELAAARM